MNYKGPVEAACKKYTQYVCKRSDSVSADKHNARRAYRRVNRLTTAQLTLDPDLYDDEVFEAPFLSSWDLW